MLGLHGTRYANLAVTNCDLLIALGARFDDRVTGKLSAFAPHAGVVHVDIDPAEIGKNVQVHVPIVGDVKQVLQAILGHLKKKDRSDWLEQIQKWKKEYPLTYGSGGDRMKAQAVIEAIYRHTRGEAIVATDVGQHQMWTAQYYRFKYPGTLISSGGLGTMGFGLPAAVGAQIGQPERLVMLITGDGSIQMNLQELATVVEQKLPIKIFIMNNKCLGLVRQLQEFYCEGRYIATEFSFVPDFTSLAGAYGMAGYTIESLAQLEEKLPEILAHPGAVIVNCMVDASENVSPMVLAGQGINEAIDC
jgi:acetolactate synthase-1/2/3 large subunit